MSVAILTDGSHPNCVTSNCALPHNSVSCVLHIQESTFWQEQVRQIGCSLSPVRIVSSADRVEAANLCRLHNADTVLLDRETDVGSDVLRQLLSLRVPPRIVVLAARASLAALYEVERYGLAGLLRKEDLNADTLRGAFATIARGHRIFSPGAEQAWRAYKAQPDAFTKRLHDESIALLPRFGRGESDAQIAVAIGRTESTVRWRRYEAMRRLNLHRTVEFVLWIRELGFAG